mmetsp:Transcript_14432/g.43177  ORF Transcript_14432/g.43177 Transcript_14432/m.43177 type:complete len:245 (+) Transcript_14432:532-1266(+)
MPGSAIIAWYCGRSPPSCGPSSRSRLRFLPSRSPLLLLRSRSSRPAPQAGRVDGCWMGSYSSTMAAGPWRSPGFFTFTMMEMEEPTPAALYAATVNLLPPLASCPICAFCKWVPAAPTSLWNGYFVSVSMWRISMLYPSTGATPSSGGRTSSSWPPGRCTTRRPAGGSGVITPKNCCTTRCLLTSGSASSASRYSCSSILRCSQMSLTRACAKFGSHDFSGSEGSRQPTWWSTAKSTCSWSKSE